MWPSFRLAFAAAVIVVASFFVVSLASTLALVRAQVERVDVDLASVIRADYSADPHRATLAPLNEEIVDVARQDVSRLQETLSGVEIVAVYHQPASAATEPEVFATPSANRGQAPPASKPNEGEPTPRPTQGVSPGWATPGLWPTSPPGTPPPASPIATPLSTAAPTSSPTPASSPIATLTPSPTQTRTPTPGPTSSPTATPTKTPTATPTPTAAPTASPTRTPTASPTPAPTESPTPTGTPMPVDGTFYLHNNPTPPLGDTWSQPVLPMDPVMPATPVLYNYDVDRDGSPGLVIARGGSGPYEGDPTKYQAWRAAEFSGAVVIDGDAKVHLWSAMKDFNSSNVGVVTVYVQDCYGWSCVELGSDTVTKGGSSWMLLTFSVPIGTYTLAPGHSLGLVVVVDASSDDDMWFAYDVGPYRSRVAVNASAAALTSETAGLGTLEFWPLDVLARLLFA